jgi:anthranilate phosphoribosyltransferase
VLLNAAAAVATGTDGALDDRLASGLVRCAEAIDSGAAAAKLKAWTATAR